MDLHAYDHSRLVGDSHLNVPAVGGALQEFILKFERFIPAAL